MDRVLSFTLDDQRRLIRSLLLIEAILVLLYIGERFIEAPFWFTRRLLDINGESSIAAWFSSLQLFAVAAVVIIKANHPGRLAPLGSAFLKFAGATFLFLSADEALFIHESIGTSLAHFAWLPRFAGGRGVWVPIYLAVAIAFAMVCAGRVRFLWTEFRRPACFLFAGTAAFMVGAAGIELIGYNVAAIATRNIETAQYVCEEWLEMVGITLVFAGVLGLAREAPTPVRVSMADARLPAHTP